DDARDLAASPLARGAAVPGRAPPRLPGGPGGGAQRRPALQGFPHRAVHREDRAPLDAPRGGRWGGAPAQRPGEPARPGAGEHPTPRRRDRRRGTLGVPARRRHALHPFVRRPGGRVAYPCDGRSAPSSCIFGTAMSDALRVAVVEDDAHYRSSLELLLRLEPGFRLAGSHRQAATLLAEAGAAGGSLPWDVVLMDIDLPAMSGIAATAALKRLRPQSTIVMLTAFEDPVRILAAIRAGADGYLL